LYVIEEGSVVTRSESLAAYLRAQAWRRLDRVESNDDGRNARCALALLDTAAYAASLPDDDPLILMLDQAGCFGPLGCDEPHELLLALPNAIIASAG
jgi:hypothetical protein